MSDRTDMENLWIKILDLFTAMEMTIRNVDTFVHGEVRATIRYLG